MADKYKLVKIPTHADARGKLSVIELKDYLDFEPKRVYYLTDASSDRGGHAVRGEKKLYVCVHGTITARIHDGKQWHEIKLSGPDDAIIMNQMCWRDFKDFSPDAVLMAISNMNYAQDKYIYDFEVFLKEAQ